MLITKRRATKTKKPKKMPKGALPRGIAKKATVPKGIQIVQEKGIGFSRTGMPKFTMPKKISINKKTY